MKLRLLLVLLLAAVAETAESQKAPPPGKRVDIGGRALHLHCAGSGRPTVLLEAGGGRFSEDWSAVQVLLSRRFHVCAYDRAGLGWSDRAPGPEPHGMEKQVLDLHALMSAADVRGPYILVGHSVGGLLARLYVDRYPKDIVGVVMVDPTHEDSPGYVKDPGPGRWVRVRDGLRPEEITPERKTFAAELQALYETRVKNPKAFGERPLVVLVAGRGSPSPMRETTDEEWHETQRKRRELLFGLTGLSGNSKALLDPVSDHNLHIDDPQLVVLAVGEVADALQHPKKLPRGASEGFVEKVRGLAEKAARGTQNDLAAVARDSDAPPVLRSDTLLRLGIAQQAAGQLTAAVETFERVSKEYRSRDDVMRRLVLAVGAALPGPGRWSEVRSRVEFAIDRSVPGTPTMRVVWPDVPAPRGQYEGKPITLDVKDATLDSVFPRLTEITSLQVKTDQGARRITFAAREMPWDQALEHMLAPHGLDFRMESSALRIGKPGDLNADQRQ